MARTNLRRIETKGITVKIYRYINEKEEMKNYEEKVYRRKVIF